MHTRSLRGLLSRIRRGGLSVDAALEKLRDLPYEDLGFAKIDNHRELRRGFPEVIFGEGKTVPQIVAIVDRISRRGQPVLVTR
ncbi:MAG TPA: 1-(5-phosphoribosyl)-5-amino-4-imidazole-carboxylate carboxylase, partial [Candidatus Polarisedimenticolia bacterium]|nr:1-(5-phosphoribosyl)-5-amino-4-imidazole-carboxylate carboxylase [Candidatus Polarisedimenticolia bacterium]